MDKNFIDFFKVNEDVEAPPLTFYLLEGKKDGVVNKKLNAKYAKCDVLKSDGFVCMTFYKKISRYE